MIHFFNDLLDVLSIKQQNLSFYVEYQTEGISDNRIPNEGKFRTIKQYKFNNIIVILSEFTSVWNFPPVLYMYYDKNLLLL